jgi:EmrB/QacA subfamily drug resistance transporter
MSTPPEAAASTGPAVVRRAAVDHPPSGSAGPLALVVILAGQLMILLDTTIVNIAIPKIQAGLGFSATGVAWVFSAYTLAFGGLLLLAGRSGDVFGRRRVLLAGVVVFTVASVVGGLAGNAGWLIAARAVQGVGGAMIGPSALALVANNFNTPAARTRALSLYSAVSGAGASVGLVLGGALTAWGSWRWAFFVNVPIGLAILVLAPRVLVETPRRRHRLDVVGAVLATAGMVGLVFGFLRAPTAGWAAPSTLTAFVGGVVLLAGFAVVQARVRHPLVPASLLADRTRSAAFLAMLLTTASIFGVYFFLTQYLQQGLHYGPLATGLAFLPLTAVMFGMVRVLPRVLARIGARPVLVAGAAMVTAALAWLSQITAGSRYPGGILGPLILVGLGAACLVFPLNVTVLATVRPDQAGVASGLVQTMQFVGGSLGLAVLVSVFGSGVAARLDLAHAVGRGFGVAAYFAAAALVVCLVAIRGPVPPIRGG